MCGFGPVFCEFVVVLFSVSLLLFSMSLLLSVSLLLFLVCFFSEFVAGFSEFVVVSEFVVDFTSVSLFCVRVLFLVSTNNDVKCGQPVFGSEREQHCAEGSLRSSDSLTFAVLNRHVVHTTLLFTFTSTQAVRN